ncbi:MAG: hypothetical protein AB2826_27300 [Candidatus Thiodiazotropha sp.]
MSIFKAGIICLSLFINPSVGCVLDAEVKVDNEGKEVDANVSSMSGDTYKVVCGKEVIYEGVVDEQHILKMSNGMEMNVAKVSRENVVIKLKKAHVLINTPNSISSGIIVLPDGKIYIQKR